MAKRQIFQRSVVFQETLSRGEQLSHVLEAARQAFDRLLLWAVSPEGEQQAEFP